LGFVSFREPDLDNHGDRCPVNLRFCQYFIIHIVEESVLYEPDDIIEEGFCMYLMILYRKVFCMNLMILSRKVFYMYLMILSRKVFCGATRPLLPPGISQIYSFKLLYNLKR
jgi:hypothetical protein